MGGKPEKAILFSSLVKETQKMESKDKSAHQVYRVSYVVNNEPRKGYYKPISEEHKYPVLLGKISVAVSVFKRLFQGKRTAEEFLVVDKNNNIVGTLSEALENFEPLNYTDEPIPEDKDKKERVIPSKKTVLEKNFIEVLFARWFFGDDDGHPHNMGLSGPPPTCMASDIDNDMFLYWFTVYIKGARPIIGVTNTKSNLTSRDWEGFPHVVDPRPYHWPTYQYPGETSLPQIVPGQGMVLSQALPKAYAESVNFKSLNQLKEAHEQKFAVALKALLTYQPEMLRKRLEEHFGDMSFDFTSLGPELASIYQQNFPLLCTAETNAKPFVDFMMKVYQETYDNAYRVVVFYMGCENNGYGLPLKATYNELYHKPSYYKNARKWIEEQNKTLLSKEDKSTHFNLEELDRRYHQVWRDSLAPSFKDLLEQSYALTQNLFKLAANNVEIIKINTKNTTDNDLTSTWDLFGNFPELKLPNLDVDKKSELRTAAELSIEFTNKFKDIVKNYYRLQRHNLNKHAEPDRDPNAIFCRELKRLVESYKNKIRNALAHDTTWADSFNRIITGLEKLSVQADLLNHLLDTDEQVNERERLTTPTTAELLPATHVDTLQKYCSSLFAWVNTLPADKFQDEITRIVDNEYAPALAMLSYRKRSDPVKDYLAVSKNDNNANRLAYILCSGSNEVGSLNRALISHFTPLMLPTSGLQSINKAHQDGSFTKQLDTYVKATIAYARTDSHVTHVLHRKTHELLKDDAREGSLFSKAIMDWADGLPNNKFRALVNSALDAYSSGSWWSTRKNEVSGYLNSKNQSKVVALILLKGEQTSSLSSILFRKIIINMERCIQEGTLKLDASTCNMFRQLASDIDDEPKNKTPASAAMVSALASFRARIEKITHEIDAPVRVPMGAPT